MTNSAEDYRMPSSKLKKVDPVKNKSAFDVNPVYHGRGLTLNISETDNSFGFALARSVEKYLGYQELKQLQSFLKCS
jgi:hypothetical protein